jgi:RimJ/RimL family protein N-acetyltransferase
VRHANNPRIARWLRDRFPHPYTEADGQKWLSIATELPEGTAFAVEVGGEAAGGVGLELKQDIERVGAEIGYWLGELYWGRGIISEALALFVRHAFATFPLERLSAQTFASNAPSRRVLEKAGFTLEGILRRAMVKHGVVEDAALYAMVRQG